MFRSSVAALYALPELLFLHLSLAPVSGTDSSCFSCCCAAIRKSNRSFSQILFAAEIPFCRLDRGMAEQELNLFQLAAAAVT